MATPFSFTKASFYRQIVCFLVFVLFGSIYLQPTFVVPRVLFGSAFEDYLKALGVTYHFLSKPLIEMAKCHLDPKKPSICTSAFSRLLISESGGVQTPICYNCSTLLVLSTRSPGSCAVLVQKPAAQCVTFKEARCFLLHLS